jgi:hypothetical protein
VNGFIGNLYTQLGNTSNYSVIANFHTLQITTACAKPFPACYILTNRSLTTASNSGYSSASCAQVLLSRRPCRTLVYCQLNYSAIFSHPLLQSSTKLSPLNWLECQRLNQSHIATDGRSVSQSVSQSWCQVQSGAHDQIFITVWQLRSCYCGVLRSHSKQLDAYPSSTIHIFGVVSESKP